LVAIQRRKTFRISGADAFVLYTRILSAEKKADRADEIRPRSPTEGDPPVVKLLHSPDLRSTAIPRGKKSIAGTEKKQGGH
jgi:hypothetical protein